MPRNASSSNLTRRLMLAPILALATGLAIVSVVAALTLNYADGTWSNATGPSGTPTCLKYFNTPALGDENQVRYGDNDQSSGCPSNSNLQSGFGFTGTSTLTFDPGEAFLLGEFVHYNRPIYASKKFEQVNLAIALGFGDPILSTALTYTMWLTETTNSPPCPYPGQTACTDKVYFLNTIPDKTFEIDGTYYTLQIVGFVPGTPATCSAGDNPVNGFITEEGQENHACLFGRVIVAEPHITLNKTPDQQTIYNGSNVSFDIKVVNDGDVELDNVQLFDAECTPSEPSGDIGNDGAMGLGERWAYTCTTNNVIQDFTNVAQVTAQVKGDPGNTVNDSDAADVDVINPSISITKEPNQKIPIGSAAAFTITVKNTGDVPLANLHVIDPLAPDCEKTIAVLAAGQSVTYHCTLPNVTQDLVNSATVEGSDPLGGTVSDTDAATVDVLPTITVAKTANPASLPEPGGEVEFTVVVANHSYEAVTLTYLEDDVHGDLDGRGTCAVPQTIPVGSSYTCAFSAPFTGNAGDSETDTVTAVAHDDEGNPVENSDDATVSISDVVPQPTDLLVVKAASPASLPEPGGSFTFDVSVANRSAVDPLTLTSLVDDVHGDLDGQGTCAVPQTIQPGASYTCAFSAPFTGNAGSSETDTVTAVAHDDEGNPVESSDDATVEISDNSAPAVSIEKTASPNSLPEPGGVFTFTLTVTNGSVEQVTITDLTDDYPLSAECLALVNTTLDAGESVSCQYTAEPTDAGAYGNTATITVEDDEGNQTSASDDESVTITDVEPTVSITKTASPTSVPEPGSQVTFSVHVENTSGESVTLTSLADDIHGDLDGQGTCSVPQTILPGGAYGCAFTTSVSGAAGDSETDTITATVEDNEGNEGNDQDQASVRITSSGDQDGDGLPDFQDPDDDSDNIPDVVEGEGDTDGDGLPDFQDPDSDGDGIPDSIEAGNDPTNPVDTDGDGIPDFQDPDSDGDGIPDSVEAGDDPTNPVDTDGDGIPDFQDPDSDGDGIPDSVEAGDDPTNPVDTDGDGLPDFQDLDSDDDGIPDAGEWSEGPDDPLAGCTADGATCFDNDADGDGTPNYLDPDSDGDGIPDGQEGLRDSDGDGIPDWLDPAPQAHGGDFLIYLPTIVRGY